VPNEAIVIPETIDAIRAMAGFETDAARSMARTDASLGIRRRFGLTLRSVEDTTG
jgi:glyceraldehyde-3-phosphate dehydrogenase (NAD(P))